MKELISPNSPTGQCFNTTAAESGKLSIHLKKKIAEEVPVFVN